MSMPSARRRERAGGTAMPEKPDKAAGSESDRAVETQELAGRYLLSPVGAHSEEQVKLVTAVTPGDATLVVVAVPDDHADALWPRLAEVMRRARQRARPVVLAMSGAGIDHPDRPALARRIADAWDLTVVAPAGDVLLVPGGTLFVQPAVGDPEPQWWSFGSRAAPEALGPRWPSPEWRQAITDVTASPHGAGPAVTAVPAGVVVHPAGTPGPGPGDVAYAIPADPERPSVIVADAQVSAADLGAVLSGSVARPEWRRHPLRLVPAGDRDLLPLGQAVARDLGIAVEVLTGPPVDLAGTRRSAETRKVVLVDNTGRHTWSPFTASVLCRPPGRDGIAPSPHVHDWETPVAGMRVADAARGVLHLGDAWRVAVTRAGLWAYPADADPDRFPERLAAAWPVAADTLRVDVGTSDRTLDDRVWPMLDKLLGALTPGARARLHLAVHGTTTAAGGEAVRRLAARHGAGLEVPDEAASQVGTVLGQQGTAPTTPTLPAAANMPPEETPREDVLPAGLGSPEASIPGNTEAAAVPAMAATTVTVTPARRSTDEERAAFRAMVGLDWDSHAAPVRRTFSRLPAIAATERAAAAADLVAVRLYLTSPADSEFGPAAARSGDETLRPYLSCLASGLGRLPTYRGAVLHGVDAPVRADLTGTVLTEPGPVGGLPPSGDAYGRPPTATVYVIWSDTARRVAALFDADNGAQDGTAARRGDVVFGPGSRFAVLDVRPGDGDTPDIVLLREIPATAVTAAGAPQDGRLALTRLDEALETVRPGPASAFLPWPAHCLGPVGVPTLPSPSAAGQAGGGPVGR